MSSVILQETKRLRLWANDRLLEALAEQHIGATGEASFDFSIPTAARRLDG